MARDLTSGFIAEINAKELCVELFVRLEFDSATTCLWTGYGTYTLNGEDYSGIGYMGGIGRIEESQFVKAVGTNLQLSGVPSSLVSLALQEPYQGRRAEIYFAVLDKTTGLVIGDPYRIFAGDMDVMEIQDTGDTATISVSVENELIDLFKARNRNYTPEDQKAEESDDLGLDFIPAIQDAEIVWKEKEG